MRPPDSVSGTPLHPVHAGLVLEPGEHTLAGHVGDDLAVAAHIRLAGRHQLDLPAVGFGKALIHAEQIAGEQGGLFSARALPGFPGLRFFHPPHPWAEAGS